MDNSFDLRRVGSYVFIAALAVLFALQWGPGARGCGSTRTEQAPETVAATVNGKTVPLRNFLIEYANQMSQYRQSGAQLPPGAAKMLGIPTQVLDRLVSLELLSQAAEARGIATSDAEVLEILVKNPGFQKDGKFDAESYRGLLRDQLRQTPQEFEADLRRRLAAQKMLQIVEAGALVADDEVKARYSKEADRANVTFVKFNALNFAGQIKPAAPMELDAWIKDNGPAIAANYEQNKMSYFQPERVKARQIVLLAAKDSGEAKLKETREKAENLRKELVAGKDFAALARQFSEDASTKDSGGELGLIERFALPPTLQDPTFKLQVGETTEVVQTPIGFHLVKVEEKLPPATRTLDEVRREIGQQLWNREQSRNLARAAAEKALAEAKAGKALSAAFPKAPTTEETTPSVVRGLGDSKPEATESGEFNSASGAVPQLGPSPTAAKAIFARTTPGLVDTVVEAGDGFAVLEVTSRKQASDADFTTQKDQIKLEAIKAKQYELRESFIKGLKKTGTVVINEQALDAVEG